MINQLDDAVAS